MLRAALAFLTLSLPCSAEGTRIWQPIIDYTISFPGDRPDAAPMINPFENFTHFGSDFGWMGPTPFSLSQTGSAVYSPP